MMEDRLKNTAEEADKERVLKEVAKAKTKEKNTTVENAEERTRAVERARVLAEQKVVKMAAKLEEVELRLDEAKSMNSAKDKEIDELKAALEVREDKWYNAGFVDAKNSAKLVMFQSRRYGFGEGWMAAMLVVGVPEDSLFRNPDQISYLEPPPPIQNPTDAEEEDTPSMKELVQEIDSHAQLIDFEITSNPNAMQSLAQPQLLDSTVQPSVDITLAQLDQPQDPIT